MNEEDFIKKQEAGKGNPFRVPEGYFDTFTAQLMSRLPREKASKASWLHKAWRYAAVIAVVAGIGSTYWVSRTHHQTAIGNGSEYYQEEYVNEALDYAMVDNDDIALYLTEAE